MTTGRINNFRKGAALLVVLFIVMAITVLSLGFLTRSDVELACGENMVLRAQMDYLAESGLEHARGLILNPQDVSSEYFTGATGLQLTAGSKDYYDLEVIRNDSDSTDYCNYIIDCNSYRLKGGEKSGFSGIRAYLRLDPSIVLWTGAKTIISNGTTIYGDVFCDGSIINSGSIDGDVFANSFSGILPAGRRYNTSDLSLNWPELTVEGFTSYYSVDTISSGSISGLTLGSLDPVRVCYRSGDLELAGNIRIEGMLLVDGDLTIRSVNNTIIAGKNLPALYVTGNLIINKDADLDIEGLAVVNCNVLVNGDAGLDVLGGMFTENIFTETASDSSGEDNNGLLYNGPRWRTTGGQLDGALEFDGVDDYIQTLDSSNKLQISNDYTLSVWIKPYSFQKDYAGIISRCNTSGETNHWTLQFDSGSSKKLAIYHPDSFVGPKWDTGITLSEVAGAWHHIGIVRQGDLMTSYLDGVPRNTNVWSNVPGNGNGHLNIGSDRTASSSHVYKGLIDDVRIYNLALDANDIFPPVDGLAGLIGYWELDESGNDVTLTAEPSKTAIIIRSSEGSTTKWGQAAGAFYKSIERK
ncbi:MAG: hypothetical protein JW715_10920 [Sedimentisphaerales bacterium]|nr:hypothetical protein [Sedimentisphaerales bacterium]